MSDFVIEKGIPVPASWRGITRQDKYGLNQMEVGDSFLIPVEANGQWRKERNKLSACMAYFHKAHPGKKFCSRRVPDGIRCWRIA